MMIDQQTITGLLQIGGQYLLPIAALLRALYHGMRRKIPEGASEIAVASLTAGLTAAVNNEQLDLRSIALTILGNGIFTAGLLAFIAAYLLRMPNRGRVVDGVVGGAAGLAFWLVWVLILQNDWPWWTIPFFIAAGAAGFIALRAALRQILRLVKIATYFIVLGVILLIGAGGLLLLYTLATGLGVLPTPTPMG